MLAEKLKTDCYLYHLPDDIFNLFIAVGVICGRTANVAGAMHLMTFTILTTALMTGTFDTLFKYWIQGESVQK